MQIVAFRNTERTGGNPAGEPGEHKWQTAPAFR